MSDREHALRILERVSTQKLPVHEAIARETGIEHHDFVRMLVHGVLRWQGRLDHAIATLADRKIKRIDPIVLLILRLGTLQVWFSEVPSYAAVSETTALAEKVARRAKSFVNAVMRRATERSLDSVDPKGPGAEDIAIRTSHPAWLVSRWMETFGSDRAEAIANANQELSYPDLLVNTRRWTRNDAIEEIRARSLEATESDLLDDMIRLRGSTNPLADLVRDGRLYPMDEGSVAVTRLFPESARRILDLCAAPGGKSLAMTLDGRTVFSSDISIGRLFPLRQSSARFFGAIPRAFAMDALQSVVTGEWDGVLIDAPCSASGTIRRNPEVRWRISEDEIRSMSEIQKRILDGALDLSPRFALYVTCSLEPEENDAVVGEVLGHRNDFQVLDVGTFTPFPLRRWLDSGVLRLTPDSGTDGFTATLLERVRGAVPSQVR